MSGGVPPSSRAGRRPSRRAQRQRTTDLRRAANLYERFTGHELDETLRIKVADMPKAAAFVGMCDGILYTTVRDGKVEHYIHEFAESDAPILAISPNGRQILLLGGRYVFTERGIVDLSDRENLPPKLRKRLGGR